MDTVGSVVIVGGGLAGAKTAEALRANGHTGTVELIAAESHLPYERPPLSKGYLAGASPFGDAVVHPAAWYAEQQITLRQGVRATAIDTSAHQVTLDTGVILAYDKLVLATGSAPRRLALAGAEAPNVHSLRTVEDADAIRATFGEGKSLVIIGGGWIGLEVAAAARTAGTTVTLLERGPLPLWRILGEQIAGVFADLHTAHGVEVRTDVRIDSIVVHDGAATGVRVNGGEVIAADAVVIGIGVTPQVALAEAAGIAVDNGVLVDAALRTSDPDVYAVGDIAGHDHPVLGYRVRVEHWATALNQPAAAVTALLGGEGGYTALPYFFTDQYDLGCEYVGHIPPGSRTRVMVRGDLAAREFVAFWLNDQEQILAAMNVNVWDVIDQITPLIAERRVIDPERLIDPDVHYADL